MMRNVLRFTLAFAVFTFNLRASPPAQAEAHAGLRSKSTTSAARWLRVDGRLDMAAAYFGAIDVSGFDVSLDPERGPLFSPKPDGPAAVSGQWEGVGDGQGALSDQVLAVAVMGSDVFVGGTFRNAANLPAADYIVRWDGQEWSALSSATFNNGCLNGGVYALAVHDSMLYVGGGFSWVNEGSITVPGAGRVASWDGTHWHGLGSNGANGSALNATVVALAVDELGTVYVGGGFTNVNNAGAVLSEADYIARWDGTNWSALSNNGSGNGALNNGVLALQVSGSDLFVGGDFTDVSDGGIALTAADYVARWDGTHWSALGDNGAGGGSITAHVTALAMNGPDLFVGGSFVNVNNHGASLPLADFLARWDGANWSAVGGGTGTAALNGVVNSLLVMNGSLYVGGCFRDVFNASSSLTAADGIARWDGANWTALGSNGSGDGAVAIPSNCFADPGSIQALGAQGNTLLVGGRYYDVNNSGTSLPGADMLAAWDGTTWAEVGPVMNGSLNGEVYAMVVHGSDVYIGGSFTNISDHGTNLLAADYVAHWDGTHWSALGSNGAGNGSLAGNVWALTLDDQGNLYVGGSFQNVRDGLTPLNTADYVARWDGTHWSAVGDNGAGNGSLNSTVFSLLVDGSALYAGGGFTNVNNHGIVNGAADYIARWDGTNWTSLGDNGAANGALNSIVTAQAKLGTDLYVGGIFTDANNHGVADPAADYVARWDGSTWSSLGSNGSGDGSLNDDPTSNLVQTLLVDGTDLYVGGYFNNVNDNGSVLAAADSIVRWDGSHWHALGDNGSGNGSISGGEVRALAMTGSTLYAGGTFSAVNVSLAAANVARWDGTTWSSLSSDGSGRSSVNGWVHELAILGEDLLVGGQFSDVKQSGTTIAEADYLAAYGIGVDVTSPTIQSITALGPNPTNQSTANFAVSFSENVTGISAADFLIAASGFASPSSMYVTGTNADYVVHILPGLGDGILGLSVPVTATITDFAGNPLAALPAVSNETISVDHSAPVVLSSIRAGASPTAGDIVSFTVTFSEPVIGLGADDFGLSSTGLTGAAIGSVSGSGSTYTVTVNTGTGDGTLRLDVSDDDGVTDLAGNPLGGAGVANGAYVSGEAYVVERQSYLYLPAVQR